MPTAWQVLISSSTLPDNGINTAWDHLNNQQGGGSNYYINEEVFVDEILINASAEVEVPVLGIEEVGILVDSIEVEGAI